MGASSSSSGRGSAPEGEALPQGKMTSWAGTVEGEWDAPPDPSRLNDVVKDDKYADIDFQSVPTRVLESLRRKVDKEAIEACRTNHEETITCMKFNATRPAVCKPILEDYYKCLRTWRADNDDLYYELVKQSLEGKLLEKHRKHQSLLESEWKLRFPDTPMPRAHVPDRRPGETSQYIHEKDKDLVQRDLAMQRLAQLDAAEQGISLEEYQRTKRVITDAETRSTWKPAF